MFREVLFVILMCLVAGCQIIQDRRMVKGVGKIEATYSLSLQEMSTGRASTPPKIYATIKGKKYRLMPMSSTSGEIAISNNDFLIEGVVPQFEGKSIDYYDQNHGVSKQILSETEEVYKRLCAVRPEYSKSATVLGLANRILSYVKDGDTRLIITTNIKSLIGSSKKTSESSEQKFPAIDQISIADANDSLGAEFKCEFVIWKVDNVTKNNKLETNYNVTGLKINGHKIDIADTLKIPATAVSADTSLILKTKDFGSVFIKLRKGNKEGEFSLKIFMTVEQKFKIEQTTR